MPLNDTILNAGNTQMQTLMTHAGLFTAATNATGTTNVATSARLPITWVTAANGDLQMTADLNFTGGTPSGTVHSVGFWSASTLGTFYGSQVLTGDPNFNAAGEYTVTDILITGTAT
jgi:hypothetical protein